MTNLNCNESFLKNKILDWNFSYHDIIRVIYDDQSLTIAYHSHKQIAIS